MVFHCQKIHIAVVNKRKYLREQLIVETELRADKPINI
jgi:hypothetical protein